jgi:hypothetical protein
VIEYQTGGTLSWDDDKDAWQGHLSAKPPHVVSKR